jgi:chitodextrinase
MTGLVVPAASRAAVAASWSAKDNLGITAYQIRTKRGSGSWSPVVTTTSRTRTMTLTSGPCTIAVRAGDAAGNWSGWRYAKVAVDAGIPTMTGLRTSQSIVRTPDGSFGAAWAATDNVGIARYQWRTRRSPDGAPSTATTTTARSRTFRLGAGTWSLEVRARDAVGNWSPWRAARVVVPRDDRAFAFSAGTNRRTGSAYYRDTLTTTRTAGATIVTGSADADGFVIVGRVGPAYGRLRVTVDGASTIVDTAYLGGVRASRIHDRVLLYSTRLARGPHSVTITVLGTSGRPTVAIDGMGFSR